MSEPFIGEIVMFAGNFAPRSWALCNGQILSIAQNTALFSLLGTTYGGNGQTTFALPNLQGRVPIHPGQGPGLSNYSLGESAGVEAVTLTSAEIAPHTHPLNCNTGSGNQTQPEGNLMAAESSAVTQIYINQPPNQTMHPQSIGNNPGGQPHENRQPYLCINFIIAIEGIYPSRN